MIYILGDNGANKRKVTHVFDEFGVNTIRLHEKPEENANFEWADRQQGASIAKKYGLLFIQSTITPCIAKLTGSRYCKCSRIKPARRSTHSTAAWTNTRVWVANQVWPFRND